MSVTMYSTVVMTQYEDSGDMSPRARPTVTVRLNDAWHCLYTGND